MKHFASVGSTEFVSALTKSAIKYGSRRGGPGAFGAQLTSSARKSSLQRDECDRPAERHSRRGLRTSQASIHTNNEIPSYTAIRKAAEEEQSSIELFQKQPPSYRKMIGWWI